MVLLSIFVCGKSQSVGLFFERQTGVESLQYLPDVTRILGSQARTALASKVQVPNPPSSQVSRLRSDDSATELHSRYTKLFRLQYPSEDTTLREVPKQRAY